MYLIDPFQNVKIPHHRWKAELVKRGSHVANQYSLKKLSRQGEAKSSNSNRRARQPLNPSYLVFKV